MQLVSFLFLPSWEGAVECSPGFLAHKAVYQGMAEGVEQSLSVGMEGKGSNQYSCLMVGMLMCTL